MRYRIYFDGASRGNPGEAGAGVVLILRDGQQLRFKQYLGIMSNNAAEWEACLLGLKQAINNGAKELEIYGDSELVIKQLKGEYKVKNEGLKPKYELAKILLKQFEYVTFNHVPREGNKEADKLSNEAIDEKDIPEIVELTPFHILNLKPHINGSVTEFLMKNTEQKLDPNGLPRLYVDIKKVKIGTISEEDKILWNNFMKDADKVMEYHVNKDEDGNIISVSDLHQKRYKLFQMVCYDLDSFRRFVFESRFLTSFRVREHIQEAIQNSDYQLLHFGILYLKKTFLIQDTDVISF